MLQRPLRSITSITTRLHQSPSSTTRLFSRPSSSAAPSTPSDSNSTPAPESETAPLDPDSSSSSYSASPGGQGKGYRAWLAGDGAKYRRGIPGRTNWLGDQVSSLSCPLLSLFSSLFGLEHSLLLALASARSARAEQSFEADQHRRSLSRISAARTMLLWLLW